MFHFVFKQSAARTLEKLPRRVRARILKKIRFYTEQKNPLEFTERLTDSTVGQWRFRIGNYRVIFDVLKDKIIILKVGHRRDIYRQ